MIPSSSFPFYFNNHEITTLEQLKQYENSILLENHLFRIDIERSKDNLFSAVSTALYMTSMFKDYLKNMCMSCLQNILVSENPLPRRLSIFYNNSQLLQDYLENPSNSKYDFVSLELISLMFQTKIIIYEIDELTFLRSLLINNNWENYLQFFRDKLGNFDCIENLGYMSKFCLFRGWIVNLVDDLLKDKKISDKDPDFNDLNENIKIFCEEKARVNVNSWNSIDYTATTMSQTAEKKKDNVFFCEESLESFAENKHAQTPGKIESKKIFNKQTSVENGQNFKTSSNNNNNPVIFIKPEKIQERDSPKFPDQRFNFKLETKNENKGPIGFVNKKLTNLKPDSEVFFIDKELNNNPSFVMNPSKGKIINKEKRQPLIIDETQELYYGILKFFDEIKCYGFIIMEEDNTEIFVHFDDFEKLEKKPITKEFLSSYKYGNIIRVSFHIMNYIGKYNMSRKAVDVKVLNY